MKIRKLNKSGIKEFERFIENLRNGGQQNTPDYLLTDPSTSAPFEWDLELEQSVFATRYELGVYLAEKLKGIDTHQIMGDSGFWSALALFWFDQLCPQKTDGNRNPSMVYNYVLSENYNHRPRHAIFTTWQLVDLYGDFSHYLLSRELPVRGELIEQLMARQYFLSCAGVMRAASTLYYDPERKTFKKGAAGRTSAGCVYRFVNWLQQLEINYDLFSLSCDELINLMPTEFERFKDN
jgi:hypothetical protein